MCLFFLDNIIVTGKKCTEVNENIDNVLIKIKDAN
jgi:hypothetical protein